jgi:choline dehydrogenase-like flavoprotein
VSKIYDVCVIGAGPAGLAATMQLSQHGWSIALVESGFENGREQTQELAGAHVMTPGTHSAMADAVCRGLGGTSAFWGGRCVPFDPVDFENRPFVKHSGWPISHLDLEPFYEGASEFLGVGKPEFEIQAEAVSGKQIRPLSEGFDNGHDVLATRLERWSVNPHMWKTHRTRIRSTSGITVFSGFTCVGLSHDAAEGPVHAATLKETGPENGSVRIISARVFVLACGGVDTTRLVLNSLHSSEGLKLPNSKLVGRFYMGHPSGKIADIQFNGQPERTIYGFERAGDVFVRRRITFDPGFLRSEQLLNIAFWLDNPPLGDPVHQSGLLSAAYLALTAPVIGRALAPAAIRQRIAETGVGNKSAHLRNLLRRPVRTVGSCSRFLYGRYLSRPRLPGFFTYSSANRYSLHYHAEQIPDWSNAVQLSDDRDATGLKRVRISLSWSHQDIDSILRAHELLDQRLRKQGVGCLIWRYPKESLPEQIEQQAVDGFHQLGTLRMGSCPSSGVTDGYGRLLGTRNLFVASSAVFPTSGQANPTLSLVAFVQRQAKHINSVLGSSVRADAA